METVAVVLNVRNEHVEAFEAGFREHELPVWRDLKDRGLLDRATLNRLDISSRPVEGATQYLVHVRLISRERPRGSRRDVYAVTDDLWYEAIVNREPLLARWEGALAGGVDALGADTPAGHRLQESVDFFAFLREELSAMLARWRARR